MATVSEAISLVEKKTQEITRFDFHQILQHTGLMVSFIILVLTGLPLKFSDSPVSQWWVGIWGGIEFTRAAHRVAAWVIVAVCLYHLAYIFYSTVVLKKPFPIRMVPGGQDIVHLFQELAYFVGIRKERPKFDRFNWREKFDYWAIFWGMPVMAGSGFILMFPVFVTRFLPGWTVSAALAAHSDEAMLALTWIFVVHIFFNHFSPGWFPLNKSIFTGKIPRERYQKDHPAEYERQFGEEGKENQG